jgi:serine/threonine-protein kinase
VIGHLGSGASATVWLCLDREAGRKVAVKSLHPGVSLQSRARARFAAEAEAMARIRHPHVLAVLGYSEEGGAPFLVVEHASGGSLEAALTRDGPQAPRRAVLLVAQLCDGVHAAHAAGVVHRDIKPGNVLLTGAGQAKLGDFGVALLARALRHTRPGTLLGTAGYLAPEQRVDARLADERSDVYGLGATLAALIGGRSPPARGPLGAELLGPLARAIAAATAWRPEDRFGSAAELARELRALADDLPESPPDGPLSPPAPFDPDQEPTELDLGG